MGLWSQWLYLSSPLFPGHKQGAGLEVDSWTWMWASNTGGSLVAFPASPQCWGWSLGPNRNDFFMICVLLYTWESRISCRLMASACPISSHCAIWGVNQQRDDVSWCVCNFLKSSLKKNHSFGFIAGTTLLIRGKNSLITNLFIQFWNFLRKNKRSAIINT